MKFTTEELKMLADGAPPRYVRTGWDCATVIPELAELILKTYSFVFKMEDYILKTEEDKEK
jgi:hypothetical protein